MAYVYHAGTQTYFDVNDDVYIIDLEGVNKDSDLDDYYWEELEPHARPLASCLKGEG